MHADSLCLRIEKKTMKNLKNQGKSNYTEEKLLQSNIIINKREYLDLQVGTVWSISSKANYKLK